MSDAAAALVAQLGFAKYGSLLENTLMLRFSLICIQSFCIFAATSFAQEAPRIKNDPQFDRDLAVASYLYAVDLIVGLTTDQAVKVAKAANENYQPTERDLWIVHIVCIGDQFQPQPLSKINGLDELLTADQKRYFAQYNKWKPRNRIKDFTDEKYQIAIAEQIRCAEELNFQLLEQVVKFSEEKAEKFRFLSRKTIDELVKKQVAARQRSNRFGKALDDVTEGTGLVQAFEPGGALDKFDGEDLKEFLAPNNISRFHPTVVSRRDTTRVDKFLRGILNDDEKERLAEFRNERTMRQARYVAHVFVAKWTGGMDLEYEQRVALMELIAKNLTPPFWPGSSRVQNKSGLKAVPLREFSAIVGEENLPSLMLSIEDTRLH